MRKREDGEGTISKRRDRSGHVTGYKGAVTVGHRLDGQPDRRWVSGASAEAVREKMEALKTARNTGMLARDDGHTVATFTERWLAHKARIVREVSLDSYRRTLEAHLLPSLGRIRLEKLKASDLDHLYTALLEKGLSTRVARYTHTLAHGMLKQAVRWGLVPRNVAEAATPPRLHTKEMRVWTPAEAARFLDRSQPDRLYAAWYLTLFTGVRRAELLGLHWRDVDLSRAEIHVRHTLVEVNGRLLLGEPKTRASRRTVAITADTVSVLEEHRARQAEEREHAAEGWTQTGLVFTSRVGTPINPGNLARAYKALIRRAGVPDIRFHDLRHTSASLAVKRGDDPKVVAERLGHTDVAFTLNTYVHTFADQRREAALGIADLFPRDGPPN